MRGRLESAIAIIAATLLIAAAPHRVHAAIIDNNVDIEWSQVGPEACEVFGLCRTEVTIIGAPRLVEDASDAGDTVFFDIAVVSPQLFAGMDLHLHIGDTSFEELTDANGDPLVLDLLVNGPLAFAAFLARPSMAWRRGGSRSMSSPTSPRCLSAPTLSSQSAALSPAAPSPRAQAILRRTADDHRQRCWHSGSRTSDVGVAAHRNGTGFRGAAISPAVGFNRLSRQPCREPFVGRAQLRHGHVMDLSNCVTLAVHG